MSIENMNDVIFAQIEPTTKCNFTCDFCCGRAMDQSNLSLEQFKQILETFPEIKHLELQGEGEPLIHPDFFTMVELATAQNIQISLITNGSLLTKKKIQRILDSNISSVRISLETVNPEQFQRIRGGSFTTVAQGIRSLITARREQKLVRPSVGLSVTLLASTLEDLTEIFKFYYRLRLDGDIAIQPLNKMPQYAQYYDAAMEEEFLTRERDGESYYRQISSALLEKIRIHKSPYTHFYDELFKPSTEDTAAGKMTACPWLESGIYVDRHGRLTPCCTVKGEAWSFGEITTVDRETVLQKRAELSAQLKSGEIPQPCQGCHIAAGIVA